MKDSKQRPNLPLLGFAAYSGTGKTTVLEALLPLLTNAGLKVGVLKHAHHDFDVDKPGKDSYRLRKAGANQMLISSRNRHVMMTETPEAEADFDYLLTRFDTNTLDLILVEGCKNIAFPKIELHRDEVGKPWLYPNDDNIIAIAADSKVESDLPQMAISDLEAIRDFIIDYAQSFDPVSKTSKVASCASSKDNTPVVCCDSFSPAGLTVTQGQQKIVDSIDALELTESVALEQGYGRVLAEDVISPINVPQNTNSAMDGYAIRSEDLELDSYHVVAEVMAGHSYNKTVQQGEAVKIMTGAPMPEGVDVVVMREQAVQEGDIVSFPDAKISVGQNVRMAGEDLEIGQPVFTRGTRIESPEMGMMASLGFGTCPVLRKVKVGVFSTGDEVQAPGSEQKPNSIYDSNRFTIIGMLQKLGCDIVDYGIIEDDEQKMMDVLHSASLETDMVLTSGGVSVGDADYIKLALDKLGEINFWRINMRPGRPLAYGKIEDKPFFGLPGNPVAVMVSFINFVEPAIRKLQGQANWTPVKANAVATEQLRSRQGRTEFSRGVFTMNESGVLEVKTTGKQGSGILRSMSEANCLIEISPSVDTVKVGETVTIIPLQGRV
ncbi:bifunctional molybdopterin-guanine dinucleotide biosynthesis adaptor protein MobB/molybdopterin molybdotransferase MoeA [Vibrio chagasii]|uniref:bifunctional molybdopterin-guanine dinucleotide biosynthesis adaptor protein MobB/molybdopterin molybdotransferase MoeA n=1 Tax=Vibrio chagasii TaxID=170679 RepID=UPI001EFD1134|nr:bifunctional molybdopterin-guanine dinucleotide biosynthesis adaptor protein MobB/molybdopterin molybdotransferase MoeA [Vibrio chagasii]MCG9672042.1 bifunctional molybdopterin-guanine dinucleotide biosynthesis adaptor protein MobB/molybdopterin molybdotransferase MoeA [Vibrio chagasii]CAH6812141.1 Molybdopterin molybdenumtransferase [Vibrio chagasii]CAH7130204.1 Molybdopterin molybdenumtransferase [Vibrio chagasii]CAH7284548.1 Molybdopterin molybdenumtransferase [Vibrio chagasii]